MSGANPAIFPSRPALMQAAADVMAGAIEAALRERGAACVALSGGSTPEPAYKLLAARALDWPSISFALVDERFVPPTHDASNERMLRRALEPALAQGARLLPLYAPAADIDAAAAEADARYAPLTIDLAMMGMGEDGHTASWFADAADFAALMDARNPRTIAAVRAPSAAPCPERLTLTFAAYLRVRRAALLITGAPKLKLARAVLSQASRVPAAHLFRPPAIAPQILAAL